jgi:hypothetical protein
MTFLRSRHPLALACCLALIAAGAQAQSAPALQAQYANLQHALAQSPFQRPMVLRANASTEAPHGNVYAIVNHPFSAVGSAFQRPAHWCDVLMLQLNVKRCEVTGGDAQPQLNVAIGKKVDQPLKDAIRVAFDYTVQAAQSDYLSVQINAPDGPLGTHDYLLKLEAVPVDAQRSFLHMSYSYQNGLAARLATSAYLATSGRNKVGFTITQRTADGRPVYVGGVQGVAERNAMRYFLAIEAFLDAQSAPGTERAERRLYSWFSATERFPRQLHEMGMADYLAMKRRQLQLTASDTASAGPAR